MANDCSECSSNKREENAAVIQLPETPQCTWLLLPPQTGPVLSLLPWRCSEAGPHGAAAVFRECLAETLVPPERPRTMAGLSQVGHAVWFA